MKIFLIVFFIFLPMSFAEKPRCYSEKEMLEFGKRIVQKLDEACRDALEVQKDELNEPCKIFETKQTLEKHNASKHVLNNK
jgi:hypothetical protein